MLCFFSRAKLRRFGVESDGGRHRGKKNAHCCEEAIDVDSQRLMLICGAVAACDGLILHFLDALFCPLMTKAALLFLQAKRAQESFCSDKELICTSSDTK